MPALTGTNLTRWRTHPQRVRGWLDIYTPPVIFARRVNQSTFTYPVTQLTYDNPDGGVGVYTDVVIGQLVRFRDTSGNVAGYGRVQKAPTSSILYINRVGQGDVDFGNNYYIDVLNEYRPTMKPPYIDPATGTQYLDETAYTDQGDNFPPVAVATYTCPDWFIDASTLVITVQFDASDSYAMTFGGTIVSYAWDVDDGSITVGTAADAAITATFPAGRRYVSITVTDDNGKTAVQHIYIPALEKTGSNAPYAVRVSRRGGAIEGGWDASFELMDADVSGYPEYSRVFYFEEEWWGTTKAALNDLNVKFIGWTVSETVNIQPLGISDNIVNARSLLGIMETMPAYSVTTQRNQTPTAWGQLVDHDWWRHLVYLLMWYSNALEIANLDQPNSFSGFPCFRLDADPGTLADQMRFLAHAAVSWFTCDQRGNLIVERNLQLSLPTPRSGLPAIVSLTAADYADEIQVEIPHKNAVSWVRGSAIQAQVINIVPLLAIAPGTAPGVEGIEDSFDRILAPSQANLNEWTGNYYAWRNHTYNGDRLPSRITIPLAHRGDVLDPAWGMDVIVTIAASSNRRGFSMTSKRCTILSVDTTYDHDTGISTDRVVVEPATAGAAAETIEVEENAYVEEPPAPYAEPDFIDPIVEAEYEIVRLYSADKNGVMRTVVWPPTSGDWESIFDPVADVGSGYEICTFAASKENPKDILQVVVQNGTYIKIYRTSDASAASPSWSEVRSITSGFYAALLFSTIQWAQTWFLQVQVDNAHCVWYHTHDNWTNMTTSTSMAFVAGGHPGGDITMRAADQNTGDVWSGYKDGSTTCLRLAADYGATFPAVNYGSFGGFYPPSTIHIPFEGNESNLILYAAGGSSSTKDAWVSKSVNRGAGWSDVTPNYSGTDYGGGYRGPEYTRIIHTYTQNSDIVALAGTKSQDKGGSNTHFFTSIDAAASWTHRHEFVTGGRVLAVGGWPWDPDIFFASMVTALQYTDDGGDTWTDISWVGADYVLWTEPVWE